MENTDQHIAPTVSETENEYSAGAEAAAAILTADFVVPHVFENVDCDTYDECTTPSNATSEIENLSSIQQLNLNLDNFDLDNVPENCPYVLTSPRSLEACRIVGVRVRKLYLILDRFSRM